MSAGTFIRDDCESYRRSMEDQGKDAPTERFRGPCSQREVDQIMARLRAQSTPR